MRTIEEILLQQQQARIRIQEIAALIDAEIQADTTLVDLTSDSKTADFREWEYVMSACGFITEALWEEAKIELNTIGESGIAANQYWYQREFKKFQYGDTLLVNDVTGKYYYAVIDETKQIIKKLAIVKGNFNWLLKVAKEDAGSNVPLTLTELNAFRSFVDLIQPPGPKIPVLSLNADLIDARYIIYYDPLTPLDVLVPLVESAYTDYLNKIDLELDSVYYITRQTQALKSVVGVIDAQLVSVNAKPSGGSYTVVTRVYAPVSGYIQKDPAVSFATALTYSAAL